MFVVLDDPGRLSQQWTRALDRYVREGGSLWITLGPASAVEGSVPVSGERISGSSSSSRLGARFQTLGQADEAHPAIHGTNRWEGVKFYQAVKVDPGKATVVARHFRYDACGYGREAG